MLLYSKFYNFKFIFLIICLYNLMLSFNLFGPQNNELTFLSEGFFFLFHSGGLHRYLVLISGILRNTDRDFMVLYAARSLF